MAVLYHFNNVSGGVRWRWGWQLSYTDVIEKESAVERSEQAGALRSILITKNGPETRSETVKQCNRCNGVWHSPGVRCGLTSQEKKSTHSNVFILVYIINHVSLLMMHSNIFSQLSIFYNGKSNHLRNLLIYMLSLTRTVDFRCRGEVQASGRLFESRFFFLKCIYCKCWTNSIYDTWVKKVDYINLENENIMIMTVVKIIKMFIKHIHHTIQNKKKALLTEPPQNSNCHLNLELFDLKWQKNKTKIKSS